MSEEEVMSKFDLEYSKKISQSFKRWRYLFLQNDPACIVLKNEDAGDAKKLLILKNLEEYIVARVNADKSDKSERSERKSEKKDKNSEILYSFSVIHGTESPGQNIRRKWWNEFKSNRTAEDICKDLNANVGELVTNGFTNLPGIFTVLSQKLKLTSSEKNGPRTLDEKLSAIASLLQTWPEILMFPEVLHQEDGKLHFYNSVTHQHQLGSVYEEMMVRLKKKYLYKSKMLSEVKEEK